MKFNRDRLCRLTLFSILALFTLLLIGSEHRREINIIVYHTQSGYANIT